MWKITNWLYDLIRKIFWSDYDPNEDFYCAKCSKPVFRRIIYCSEQCEKEHEAEMRKM